MEPLELGCGTVPGPRWIRHSLGSPPWPQQPQHTQQGLQKCLPSPWCKELYKNTGIMGCSVHFFADLQWLTSVCFSLWFWKRREDLDPK